MTDEQIWEKVVSVMRENFDDDALPVTRTTTAKDVSGWNSLAHIELLVALQSAFRMKFNTGEIASLKNVGELADTITRRLREAGK